MEKSADAVTIAGQVRADYKTHNNGKKDSSVLRTRLWVNGQINDNWSYTGMLQSEQDMMDNAGNDSIELKRAYLEGKVGGVKVLAGKWNEFFYNANILDAWTEGVKLTYGDDVKVSAIVADNINGVHENENEEIDGLNSPAGDLYAVNVATKVGVVDVSANYFYVEDAADEKDAVADKGKKEIYNVNVAFDVAKDVRFSYEYMWGDKEYNKTVSKDGYWARLDYKGADASVPGSYGIHAQIFEQPINCYYSPTTDATTFSDGYEGWGVGVDYTLAKNIQLCVNYYDTQAIKAAGKDEVLYSELYFFF